jgi:hypothetical protein
MPDTGGTWTEFLRATALGGFADARFSPWPVHSMGDPSAEFIRLYLPFNLAG